MSNQSVNGSQGSQPTNNRLRIIPSYLSNYKKEYIYINMLEEELQYCINNIDKLNNGLFKNNKKVKLIKKMLKEFDNIVINDDLVFDENDLLNLLNVKKHFDLWKLRYDACNGVSDSDEDCGDVNEVVYPGFGKIYYLFYKFFNKLFICYNDESELDSYSDIEDFDKLILYSDSDSDF